MKEGSYDFEALKTLMKLYLLYPQLANQEKVEMVRAIRRARWASWVPGIRWPDGAGRPASMVSACHTDITLW